MGHTHECKKGFSLCDGHWPIFSDATSHTSGKERPECNNWAKSRGFFTAMFRQPEQRLLSGFRINHGQHTKLCGDCELSLDDYKKKYSGVQVKMMMGFPSRVEVPKAKMRELTGLAISRLDEGFIFVGLTEKWNLSVCLFHAMFGGNCH